MVQLLVAHFIDNTGTGSAGIYMDAINGDFIGSDYGFVGQNNAGYMEYTVSPSSPLPYHYFAQSVGIGTTSPNAKLEVSGDTGGGDSIVRFQNTNSTAKSTRIQLLDSAGNVGDALIAYDHSNASSALHYLGMGVNNNTTLVVNNSDNVGIGETSPDTTLHVKNSGSIVLTIERPGDGKAVSFTNGIQEVGWISYTGSNGVSYNSASDYRLKEDLQDFNGLDKISKIKMYDYKWKSGNDRSYGAMAHELQEIIPYAVSGEKDGEDMQGVDYSKIVPLLVKSIQEQQKQIEELKQIIKNK